MLVQHLGQRGVGAARGEVATVIFANLSTGLSLLGIRKRICKDVARTLRAGSSSSRVLGFPAGRADVAEKVNERQ